MRLFYLIVSLWLCAISCTPAPPQQVAPALLFNSDEITLTLTPGNAPVETLLTLSLKADDLVAVSGELSGIGMYMGVVPLRFSQTAENQWQAEFLLGACSDPDMQWQLMLQLKNKQGKKSTLKHTLQSSWR